MQRLCGARPERRKRSCAGCGRPGAPRLEFHADVAQLGIELERMHAALAADPGLFRAAEGGAQVAQEPAVDPADADFYFRGDAVRAREVGSPDGAGEPVLRV